MRALAIPLILLLATAPAAGLSLSKPGLTMKLLQAPCQLEPVLAHVQVQFRARFQLAEVVLNGKALPACWLDGGETVYMQFDDGSGGPLPKKVFRQITEI